MADEFFYTAQVGADFRRFNRKCLKDHERTGLQTLRWHRKRVNACKKVADLRVRKRGTDADAAVASRGAQNRVAICLGFIPAANAANIQLDRSVRRQSAEGVKQDMHTLNWIITAKVSNP